MSATLSITELAKQILDQVNTLSQKLESLNAPQPSFSIDGPVAYPEDVTQNRLQLLDLTFHLRQLILGPQDYLRWESFAWKHDDMMLYAFSKLGIFEAVPPDGSEISYAEIATKTGVAEGSVFRLIRYGRVNNLFKETRPGYVAHTAFSAIALKDNRSKSFIEHKYEDITWSSIREVEAIQRFGNSEEPDACGFGLAYGLQPGENIFSAFDQIENGRRAGRFGEAMAYNATGGQHNVSHVLRGFDWESLGEALVVDLGGSTGHVTFEIAKNHPKLKFIVQDRPSLRRSFETVLPESLRDRVIFESHDFFTPQTVQANVFFMKFILHDWSDKYAVRILENLVPVLRDGDRLVIQDAVLPPHGSVPQPLQKLGYALDMQMMTALNAKERTREDWVRLFETADKRFEVKAFVQPPGCATTVIEIVFHV